MFIIFSIREKVLLQQPLTGVRCPLPGNNSDVEIVVKQKYLHLLGPWAPTGLKTTELYCAGTYTRIPAASWTSEMKTAAQKAQQTARIPAGLFRNLMLVPALLLALFGIGKVLNQQRGIKTTANKAALRERFSNVAAGDFLIVSFTADEDGKTANALTLMKVVRVNGDTVVVRKSNQVLNSMKAADAAEIDHSEQNFSPNEISYQLNTFKNVENKKALLRFDGSYDGNAIDIEKTR